MACGALPAGLQFLALGKLYIGRSIHLLRHILDAYATLLLLMDIAVGLSRCVRTTLAIVVITAGNWLRHSQDITLRRISYMETTCATLLLWLYIGCGIRTTLAMLIALAIVVMTTGNWLQHSLSNVWCSWSGTCSQASCVVKAQCSRPLVTHGGAVPQARFGASSIYATAFVRASCSFGRTIAKFVTVRVSILCLSVLSRRSDQAPSR